MKFFIDTAFVDEIKEALSWGVLDGVTTNPTLIAKTGRSYRETIAEICSLVEGPVSAEVVSTSAEEMVLEAQELAEIADNIAIKVPMTKEGLKVTKILSAEEIMVNQTLVFSVGQALLAAKAGATFISPFVGRFDDIGQVGMDLVGDIITVYDNYGIQTEIIVASIRNPLHVVDAALYGADIATIPFSVLEQLFKHPLTDIGVKRFLDDWAKIPKE